jgi:hypothetical protein
MTVIRASQAASVSPSSGTVSTFGPSCLGIIEPVLGRGLVPGLIIWLVAIVAVEPTSSSAPVIPVAEEKVDPLDRGGSGKRLPLGEDGTEVPSKPEENRWIALGRRRGGVAATGKRLGDGGGIKVVCGAEDAKETVDALPRFRAWTADLEAVDGVGWD